ncbi:MAG: hypothetical protein ACKOYJ_00295 [Planctomycetia bacterium]
MRFVQVYHGGGNVGWDTHCNNDGQHRINAEQTDPQKLTGVEPARVIRELLA